MTDTTKNIKNNTAYCMIAKCGACSSKLVKLSTIYAIDVAITEKRKHNPITVNALNLHPP